MKLLSILLALFITSVSFGKIYLNDGYGPVPFNYKGQFSRLNQSESYSIRGILIRLNTPVKTKIDGHTKFVYYGIQVDLRSHPYLANKYIQYLDEAPVYPFN